MTGLSAEKNEYGRAWALTLAGVLLVYLLLASGLNLPLLSHSPYDSYTLQALLWREGRVALEEDVSWLELAVYNGKYYVSFPPFPSVVMYLLTFPFGAETPSMAVGLAACLGSCLLAFAIACRLGYRPGECAALALFWTCGCGLLDVSLSGGVWHVA